MFSISNAIAYENMMVEAKYPKLSSIIKTIGNSRWIDIAGKAQGKWSPQEGEIVLHLLRSIRDASCDPNIYIVTPFVDVQNGLRNLLISSSALDGWINNQHEWVSEHVGTVHTVQGREAEAVIFVLGAPDSTQSGARNWAGKTPNLINVAVTRAKEALYVIGNKELWKTSGYFSELYRRLK
jgi:superfamily I DNA and/or RNA helicase